MRAPGWKSAKRYYAARAVRGFIRSKFFASLAEMSSCNGYSTSHGVGGQRA